MRKNNLVWITLLLLFIPPYAVRASDYVSNLAYYEGLGGEFNLTSHKGVKVKSKELNNKILLLFFGYATCPDICPTTLTKMEQLTTALGAKAKLIQVVFITIDPVRDTVSKLNSYIPFFHPDFLGLTGSEEAINRVARQFSARFIRAETGSAAGYFFNHSDYVYLIDRSAIVRALYRTHTPTDQILADIHALIDGEDE